MRGRRFTGRSFLRLLLVLAGLQVPWLLGLIPVYAYLGVPTPVGIAVWWAGMRIAIFLGAFGLLTFLVGLLVWALGRILLEFICPANGKDEETK